MPESLEQVLASLRAIDDPLDRARRAQQVINQVAAVRNDAVAVLWPTWTRGPAELADETGIPKSQIVWATRGIAKSSSPG